jgi:hypothetical protein
VTIPYVLFAGEVAPFAGTGEEADNNILTHTWEEVDNPFRPSIPKAWSEATGVTEFAKTTHKCKSCGAMWFSQESYYECGKAVLLTENLMLSRRPSRPKYSS